jgi:hypothetical protein
MIAQRLTSRHQTRQITEKVLPNLTAEDLKDLGISIVGHRRTLLDAIAALRAHAENKAPTSRSLAAQLQGGAFDDAFPHFCWGTLMDYVIPECHRCRSRTGHKPRVGDPIFGLRHHEQSDVGCSAQADHS